MFDVNITEAEKTALIGFATDSIRRQVSYGADQANLAVVRDMLEVLRLLAEVHPAKKDVGE